MTDSKPILFYDIASAAPVHSFAPNPWKARYALNFKGVHYRTEWVELPEVESTRKKLGSDPVRFFADGSPFYTLPVIKDTSTGELVGDTFDIAVYLDKAYPDAPRLFPPSSIGLHKAFNAQVDAIFSTYVHLFVHGIPFNPETAEESRATFVRRAGASCWDDLNYRGEEREQKLKQFEADLGNLAKYYIHKDGPFLEGKNPSYADLIVGGWLMMMKETLKEWEDLCTWHDGIWKRIHLALDKYTQVK
ncbi:hypothetical protein VNI00_002942 [Paramarasmius palmivorus]|uniref:GST N-terminal domain-containing protein n=1 Tax=Paramarasmius palmivorus TaxID=297713 RepID=A0AAW0DZA6_9AGAR